MNVLILGSGPSERSWADWFLAHEGHRVAAVFPGFSPPIPADIPVAGDLDDALARVGLDTVVVGGPIRERGEFLRRAAAEGLAIICLHPPGPDSEAYYQVALSRSETGAVIVPDLPLRLHPGVDALRQAIATAELGQIRGLRFELPVPETDVDLARVVFPEVVDVVRSLIGEIEALTATGDPPGQAPDLELVVQLRAGDSRRGEVRIGSASTSHEAQLTLMAASGSLTLAFDPSLLGPSRLIQRSTRGDEHVEEIDAWDRHAAIIEVLRQSRGVREPEQLPAPNLLDATRAMELSEATVRSLRRGRTVDLHYEAISEDANFKSVMTSTGCMILLAALVAVLVALAGPPLGFYWTIYIAYVVPPVLVLFMLMQALRLGVKKPAAARANDQPPAA
jgi:myo-inositol 2-dehydrogenase/D-chiro-inositol 1-dehydrogenase